MKLCLHHGLPNALLNYLATKTILDSRVEQGQVDAPLLIRRLCRILLIPNAKERLVCQVHWSVHVAVRVAAILDKIDTLRKVCIDGWQSLLSDRIIQVHVGEISVSIVLSVSVRPELLELRLRLLVYHFMSVRAVVEVLIPVNTYIVGSWNVFPIFFVLGGQLR